MSMPSLSLTNGTPQVDATTPWYIKTNELYGPFLLMGINCPKATESLWGNSLLFTTKFPIGSGSEWHHSAHLLLMDVNLWLPWLQPGDFAKTH